MELSNQQKSAIEYLKLVGWVEKTEMELRGYPESLLKALVLKGIAHESCDVYRLIEGTYNKEDL